MLTREYAAMHSQELAHWWFRGRRRVLVDLLGTVASRSRLPLRILDYGCGTGGNVRAFTSFGAVTGIEPDQTAVRLAKARGGAQYCRTRGTELPFCGASFDAVVASDVLEHIEDDRAAVLEISRVLRPGGALIVSVPAHQWLFSEHDAALLHFRRYGKAELQALLAGAGLRVRRLSYWNTMLFPVICLRRMLPRRPRRGEAPRSDTGSTPWLINEALAALLTAEAAILRHAPLPWGISLVAIAERG